MEIEQMMAHLLAEIRTNREETRAGQEFLKEEILTEKETNQEKMMSKLNASHEVMMARMDSQLEKMNNTVLEVNREHSLSKSDHQEVLKEEAAVKNIRALKDLYGPVSSRREPPTAEETDPDQW
jgi:hypothetical protein